MRNSFKLRCLALGSFRWLPFFGLTKIFADRIRQIDVVSQKTKCFWSWSDLASGSEKCSEFYPTGSVFMWQLVESLLSLIAMSSSFDNFQVCWITLRLLFDPLDQYHIISKFWWRLDISIVGNVIAPVWPRGQFHEQT